MRAIILSALTVLVALMSSCTQHTTRSASLPASTKATSQPQTSATLLTNEPPLQAPAAAPPCYPPFKPTPTNMAAGQQLTLYSQVGTLPLKSFAVTTSVHVGASVAVDLGEGCDDAADFTTTGPIRIIGQQPAPLPTSGLNAVNVLATGTGTGTVHINGRRTCATAGILAGSCFGDPTWRATVTIKIIPGAGRHG